MSKKKKGMKRKKNIIGLQCDFCESRAVANFQKIWVKFIIDKKGKYKKDTNFRGEDFEEPIENNNLHLCKKHLKRFIEGEI